MAGRIPPNCNGRLSIEERTFAYTEKPLFENRHVTFYGGYDVDTNRLIGIKKIPFREFYTHREIEILKTLKHHHIVRHIASMIDANGIAFIVMDLARGASLDKTHKDNFKKTSNIKALAYQLFEALSYLHKKNIIHYDLCDRNIFWDPKTNALTLIDFDAAQYVGTEHTGGRTPSFAAPEVLLKKRNHTTQVDLWSAGCVIFFVFERCNLFPLETWMINPKEQSQEVLINIFTQIGLPTNEYLSECENNDFPIPPDFEQPPPFLENAIKIVLDERNLDEVEQNQWIHLFKSLIKYEDRGKAKDYLRHPLLASLIKIRVVAEQAMSLSIHQGEELVYSEDFTHAAEECVHLTSSPEYTLSAKMGGEEKRCNRPLNEGEILHVKSLFAVPNDPNAAEPTSKKSKTDD